MSTGRGIAKSVLLALIGIRSIALAETARAPWAATLDDHPELAISPAFVVGVDSGGAGWSDRADTRVDTPITSTLLPTIHNAGCESVVGVCSCVASAGSNCSTNQCAASCNLVGGQ